MPLLDLVLAGLVVHFVVVRILDFENWRWVSSREAVTERGINDS